MIFFLVRIQIYIIYIYLYNNPKENYIGTKDIPHQSKYFFDVQANSKRVLFFKASLNNLSGVFKVASSPHWGKREEGEGIGRRREREGKGEKKGKGREKGSEREEYRKGREKVRVKSSLKMGGWGRKSS